MSAWFERALVVDDLASSRAWLAQALEQAFPGIVIAAAGSLCEAECLLDPPPPLVLIDLALPDGSGVSLIERLRGRSMCVVATVFDDDAHLFPALHAGAQGYVLKDQGHETLAGMLRGIAAGQPPLSPSIARRLLRHFAPPPSHDPPAAPVAAAAHDVLTPRENEVLRLIAKGMTRQDVARALAISTHTVAGYLKGIYRKLSVGSRAEAALEAARRGLVG